MYVYTSKTFGISSLKCSILLLNYNCRIKISKNYNDIKPFKQVTRTSKRSFKHHLTYMKRACRHPRESRIVIQNKPRFNPPITDKINVCTEKQTRLVVDQRQPYWFLWSF